MAEASGGTAEAVVDARHAAAGVCAARSVNPAREDVAAEEEGAGSAATVAGAGRACLVVTDL